MPRDVLLFGAVAYGPQVVTIWDGFKKYFVKHDLPFDYMLYSNYERQVEDLLAGRIDVAWNSPLAWVRAERLGRACGKRVEALTMRDTDRDLHTVFVVRADAPFQSVEDLKGRTIGVGAVDSPQATLIPLSHLRRAGMNPDVEFKVLRHEVLGGLHGDHIGGEREAARSLFEGRADVACMTEENYKLFQREGTIPSGATRILLRTEPFDHCNMTVGPEAPPALVERFRTLLLAMNPSDPDLKEVLALENVNAWVDARVDNYAALDNAVNQSAFYDAGGAITARNYVY